VVGALGVALLLWGWLGADTWAQNKPTNAKPEWNEQRAGYWKCPAGYTEYVAQPVRDHRHDMNAIAGYYLAPNLDKNGVPVPEIPPKPICVKEP
jgi:hypothetical protein